MQSTIQVPGTVAALVALALYACTPSKVAAVESAPAAVRSAEVRIGPIAQGRTHLAEVVPEQSVRILAQVPGTVTKLPGAEGALVQSGNALVHIAAPDVAARVARIHAERKRAERERDFACRSLKTDRELAKSGDLAAIQLDRSERSCASAELAVDGARAGEREALVAKSRAVERAPFDGQVLLHLVDVGQTVGPGAPLMQFASHERLLRLRVPASDLLGIAVGGKVTSDVGPGHIVSLGAQAQGAGRVVEVLIQLDQELDLRVGTTLNVTLIFAEKSDASAVPAGAIAGVDGAYYLLLIEGESLRRVEVNPGIRDAGWVAIEPALPKGSQVVASSVASLDPASRVLVVKP